MHASYRVSHPAIMAFAVTAKNGDRALWCNELEGFSVYPTALVAMLSTEQVAATQELYRRAYAKACAETFGDAFSHPAMSFYSPLAAPPPSDETPPEYCL